MMYSKLFVDSFARVKISYADDTNTNHKTIYYKIARYAINMSFIELNMCPLPFIDKLKNKQLK